VKLTAHIQLVRRLRLVEFCFCLPSTPAWHAQEQFSIFFLPVEKLRIGRLPCADRAYRPVSNNRPVKLSRISTCCADHTFGFMRMGKKWRL
jgi:hypothetical protein